jgi:hypothetical protein
VLRLFHGQGDGEVREEPDGVTFARGCV